MTEVRSLPITQKEPQLEEILESLLSEGKMAANDSHLDRFCVTPSTELFLDSLLTHSLHPSHEQAVLHHNGPQNSPPSHNTLLFGNSSNYLGGSPSHSDSYLTGQSSPLSDSSASELGSSSMGYSPYKGLQQEDLERKDTRSPSAMSRVYPATATCGESSPPPMLTRPHATGEGAGLEGFQGAESAYEDLQLPPLTPQELDLDLLEMGTSPQPSSPLSSVDLASCPADRRALKVSLEERAMLEADGIYLPEDMPLTKAEEKNLRKVRRKLKNRVSAHESRKRKKEYVDGLEERVEKCTKDNRHLQRKVTTLQQHNRALVGQLKRLQKLIGSYNPSLLQGGCLMVMVLSFSLFFIPNFIPNGMGTGLGDTALATGAIAMGARSRALLETAEDTGLPKRGDDPLHSPRDTPPLHLHHAFLNNEEFVIHEEEQEVVTSEDQKQKVVTSEDQKQEVITREDQKQEVVTREEEKQEVVTSPAQSRLNSANSHGGHNLEDL